MEVAFEYNSDLTFETFKELYKFGNFQDLTESQMEYLIENTKWKYQCINKETGQTVSMCRCITDEVSTLIITDIVVHPDWHYPSARFAKVLIDNLVEFFVEHLEENENLKVILTNMDEWSYKELSKTFTGDSSCLMKVFKKEE